MNIPPEFWKSLTDSEFVKVCETSILDRRLCRRLWAIQGFTDKPPHSMFVTLNREDVLRMFPPKSAAQLEQFEEMMGLKKDNK